MADTEAPGHPFQDDDIAKPRFSVASKATYSIFGLSKNVRDLPLLQKFYELQPSLRWAVTYALFSLTDADLIRRGDWQEARMKDLEDRVFSLTERRGDHRTDILDEVVKMHTTRNWYYEVETVRVGRCWKKRAVIGSRYAMPEMELVFRERKGGKIAYTTGKKERALRVPLEVKGRRVHQPDGKDIWALPKDRYVIEAIRWRWVQSFNDDLLLTPALEESGKRKGLPKKDTRGRTLHKGSPLKISENIFNALERLRIEGGRSKYACHLLLSLVSNINKTERGIEAKRVYRMLGIPEDFTDKEKEAIVADAVVRLMKIDVLLSKSDTTPHPDPPSRPNPFYRFFRAPEYTPLTGIVSKEDALAIEAEYDDAPPQTDAMPVPDQAVLPGIEDGPPIPSGADIRAARGAAGNMSLRAFESMIKGPSFKTWQKYERGETNSVRTTPEVWKKVREFVAEHLPKADPEGEGNGS